MKRPSLTLTQYENLRGGGMEYERKNDRSKTRKSGKKHGRHCAENIVGQL